ncbi:MAG: heavy-metal-associated domain-containing protein [Spirochaetes bacterium]|nr:heavy-metal-associated domain-containing protein [Spirochaetota bacterium]
MKTIVLDIMGMSCQHCVRTVHKTLSQMKGVSSVEVTLHPGRATIVGEDTITGHDLVQALQTQTDYTAKVHQEIKP